MNIGIVKILQSAKHTFSLIVFGVSALLCYTGHLDGMSLAAITSTIGAATLWAHMKTDVACLNQMPINNMPPKGNV